MDKQLIYKLAKPVNGWDLETGKLLVSGGGASDYHTWTIFDKVRNKRDYKEQINGATDTRVLPRLGP